MTTMLANNKEQNHSLKWKLNKQEPSLQQYYAVIRKERVVTRTVIYGEYSCIGNLTLEAIE